MKTLLRAMAAGLAALWIPMADAAPAGNAFSYQGRLQSAGAPVSGRYDLVFGLYDADAEGTRYGPVLTNSAVAVSNGLFTATLDFGPDVFHGQARWLEISVRTNASGAYTMLHPRQPILPAPSALFAQQAQSVSSGYLADPLFLGTTAPFSLILNVNNQRALVLEPTDSAPNLIGGSVYNTTAAGVKGAVIAGGGEVGAGHLVGADYGAVGGGAGNQALDRYTTVGGGFNNYASGYASGVASGMHGTVTNEFGVVSGGLGNFLAGASGVISGGYSNTVLGDYSVVSGGYQQYLDMLASYCFAGGGWGHYLNAYASAIVGGGYNTATNDYTFIGGGSSNTVGGLASVISGGQENFADAPWSTVSGGLQNWARGDAAAVGGGFFNYALQFDTVSGGARNEATGGFSSIAGGATNTASGYASAIAGGQFNQATARGAFAAGSGALATHEGAFVWSDSRVNATGTLYTTASSATNEFTVRATGGARIITAITIPSGTVSAGVKLTPGAGAWSSLSDRNAKENFTPVDPRAVLDKVAGLPLSTWNYKAQDKSVRHMGPMAQDFSQAFMLGDDDVSITTVDTDGVALAAIQGLNQVVHEKDAEIQALKARLAALEKLVSEMAARR